MRTVQINDTITVLFQGRTPEGEVFDQADADRPLVFTVGDERIMPAFNAAVLGMREGESKTFTLAPDEAFGPHLPELVQTVPRSRIPGEVSVGAVVAMHMEREGARHRMPAQVIAVEQDTVTVDFNHPLAGRPLTYTVTVQRIAPATSG